MLGRSDSSTHRSTSAWSRSALALFALLLLGLTALPGCSGCRKSAAVKKQEEEELKRKKEKEKPKPDYELTQLHTYPDDPDQVQNFVKPGHWVTVMQQLRANNFDFSADLELLATDADGRPYPIEDTDFEVAMSRPAPLPKGQIKTFESLIYVPRIAKATGTMENARKVWLDSRLRSARGGNKVAEGREGTTDLEDFSYFFVVLARQPNNYRFLKVLDAVVPPAPSADAGRLNHYRIVLPKVSDFVSVPSHPLAWTSTAYVLWDDLDPQLLTPDQQTAIIDWLHWGGQLIISGPSSLEALERGFLGDYLPAERSQAVELGDEQLTELNNAYSLPSVKDPADKRRLTLKSDRPLLGIQWRVHLAATVLPDTGGLVCERRVGAGRIVATALPLDDPAIRDWKSFDNFFNSCLLRRPARSFVALANPDHPLAQPKWVGFDEGLATDPRFCSTLRYFTRDIGLSLDQGAPTKDDNEEKPADNPPTPTAVPAVPAGAIPPQPLSTIGRWDDRDAPRVNLGLYTDLDDFRFRGTSTDRLSGVAGWNDASGATVAVREAMKEAAGIKIPEAPFVLKLLAIYLVVLVPANWLVFRLIGRVEWAWAAVPIIAIAGAASVIRLAQLDIGFVRSRREVAILELQGGYPRGHLTRYSLLYSSLSTDYNVAFDDPSALAQPLAKPVEGPRSRATLSSSRPMQVRREDKVQLRRFLVHSNSTELLHSEQMYPMSGGIELQGDDQAGWRLNNAGALKLRDVGLVRRTADNKLQTAWIGDLAGRSELAVEFETRSHNEALLEPWLERWSDSSVTSRDGPGQEGEIRLGRLIDLAVRKMKLGPGDIRLVGWTDEELSGVTFQPGAAQTTTRTLAICHLRRGDLPAIARDVNVRTDFYAPKVETEDESNPDPPPPPEAKP